MQLEPYLNGTVLHTEMFYFTSQKETWVEKKLMRGKTCDGNESCDSEMQCSIQCVMLQGALVKPPDFKWIAYFKV